MTSRIIVSVLCITLAAAALAVVVLAWTIPQKSIDGLQDGVNWLRDHNHDEEKAMLTFGAAIVAIIALTVVGLELVPTEGPEVKITDVNTGDAVLSTADIGERIEEAVREVPNVSTVKAIVGSKRKGVTVLLDLHVEPEANLAGVADAASLATRDVLAQRVHVALAQPPQIKLHYRELLMQRAKVRESSRPEGLVVEPPPGTVVVRPSPPMAFETSEQPRTEA